MRMQNALRQSRGCTACFKHLFSQAWLAPREPASCYTSRGPKLPTAHARPGANRIARSPAIPQEAYSKTLEAATAIAYVTNKHRTRICDAQQRGDMPRRLRGRSLEPCGPRRDVDFIESPTGSCKEVANGC